MAGNSTVDTDPFSPGSRFQPWNVYSGKHSQTLRPRTHLRPVVCAYQFVGYLGYLRPKASPHFVEHPLIPTMSEYGVRLCSASHLADQRLTIPSVPFVLSRAKRLLCVHDSSPYSTTIHTDTVESVLRTISLLSAAAVPDCIRHLLSTGRFASPTVVVTICPSIHHDTAKHLSTKLRCTS